MATKNVATKSASRVLSDAYFALVKKLRSSGLTQPQLAKKVGIAQSTISAVLTGSRSLTKDQIVALSKFFHVAPAAFLPG
jgi:HTH-type transcriptional regulator/antitoxin HigA